MKILWLSQHTPLEPQIAELQSIFGEGVEICQDVNPFKSADDIQQRFKEGGYDDLVVVAPLSVIQHLCQTGLYPLWAEMEQVQNPSKADLTYRSRHYRFVGLKRVKAVGMTFFDEVIPLVNCQR